MLNHLNMLNNVSKWLVRFGNALNQLVQHTVLVDRRSGWFHVCLRLMLDSDFFLHLLSAALHIGWKDQATPCLFGITKGYRSKGKKKKKRDETWERVREEEMGREKLWFVVAKGERSISKITQYWWGKKLTTNLLEKETNNHDKSQLGRDRAGGTEHQSPLSCRWDDVLLH